MPHIISQTQVLDIASSEMSILDGHHIRMLCESHEQLRQHVQHLETQLATFSQMARDIHIIMYRQSLFGISTRFQGDIRDKLKELARYHESN